MLIRHPAPAGCKLKTETIRMMFKDTADVNQRLGNQQYIASDEIATVAVSYTHLDVYKRQ